MNTSAPSEPSTPRLSVIKLCAALLTVVAISLATLVNADTEEDVHADLVAKFEAERDRNAHVNAVGDWRLFNFEISNENPFPIYDPDIVCTINAPSGTALGRTTATAYVTVPAQGRAAMSSLRMVFYDATTLRPARLPDQAQTATCQLERFASIVALDGVPVRTATQLSDWCTRYHRCGR